MSNERSKRELVDELRSELRAAQAAVAAVDHAVATRLGINRTDHRCLDLIDQRGPMTASALADALGLSRSAVTTMLDRLERRRYLRRVHASEDRRQVLVELTPLLRRRVRTLYDDSGREVERGLDRYSVDELVLLRDFVGWDRERNERRAHRLAARGAPRRRNDGGSS